MGYEFSQDFDNAFKQAEVRSKGDYPSIPEGAYDVIVDAVELTASKAGDPMFKWTLKIQNSEDGMNIGRLLWKNTMIAGAIGILKNDLAMCGCKPASINDLNDPKVLEVLLNVPLEIRVVNKESKGKTYTNVYFQKRIETENTGDLESSFNELPF